MAFIFRVFLSVSDGDESEDLIGYVSRQLVVVRYFPQNDTKRPFFI